MDIRQRDLLQLIFIFFGLLTLRRAMVHLVRLRCSFLGESLLRHTFPNGQMMKTLTSNITRFIVSENDPTGVAYVVMLVLIVFASLAAIQSIDTAATVANAADRTIVETEAKTGGEADLIASPEYLGDSASVTFAGCVPGQNFCEPLY